MKIPRQQDTTTIYYDPLAAVTEICCPSEGWRCCRDFGHVPTLSSSIRAEDPLSVGDG